MTRLQVRRDAGRRAAVAAAVLVATGVALALSDDALAAVVGILGVLSYLQLRSVLAVPGAALHRTTTPTMPIGLLAVVASVLLAWLGRGRDLPWVLVGLVLVALVVRILLLEMRDLPPGGATADVAATVTAAGAVGLGGAHALLVRALERFGLRGAATFGVLVLVARCVAYVVARSPAPRTSVPVAAGAAIAVGLVAGLWVDPLDLAGGAILGALVGVTAPVGHAAVRALVRDGRVPQPLAMVSPYVASAPVFYWAYRSLVV